MLFTSLRSSTLQTTAEMDWCRVVGPRGLCRPLDEKQGFPTKNPPLGPCKSRSKCNHPCPGRDRCPLRQATGWRPYCVRRSRVISFPAYRETLPSFTVLLRPSAWGLGRSLERPGQRRSRQVREPAGACNQIQLDRNIRRYWDVITDYALSG